MSRAVYPVIERRENSSPGENTYKEREEGNSRGAQNPLCLPPNLPSEMKELQTKTQWRAHVKFWFVSRRWTLLGGRRWKEE